MNSLYEFKDNYITPELFEPNDIQPVGYDLRGRWIGVDAWKKRFGNRQYIVAKKGKPKR